MGSKSAGIRGQGRMRMKARVLSVQADFTFLIFQGALRIPIKARALNVEYPIRILALSLLSLLSFFLDPILLPACWLGSCSFLLIIIILWLLLIHIFKHSFSVASKHAGPRGCRTQGGPGGHRRAVSAARPGPGRGAGTGPGSAGGTGAARARAPPSPPPEAETCFLQQRAGAGLPLPVLSFLLVFFPRFPHCSLAHLPLPAP